MGKQRLFSMFVSVSIIFSASLYTGITIETSITHSSITINGFAPRTKHHQTDADNFFAKTLNPSQFYLGFNPWNKFIQHCI